MESIKTAISIRKQLFREIDLLARRLKITRSKLFALAAEEFMRRHRNEDLLKQINDVYSTDANQEDMQYLKRAKHKHRKAVGDDW